ncbi:hypothetical protein HanRHA438_Chr17g0836201 [Helianthus annuus]|nr:hypothetical protein HanRHA438_Chr17g0836201 [Helianthus annuus]
MLEIQLWVRIPGMVHTVLIIIIIITPFLNIQMSESIKKLEKVATRSNGRVALASDFIPKSNFTFL